MYGHAGAIRICWLLFTLSGLSWCQPDSKWPPEVEAEVDCGQVPHVDNSQLVKSDGSRYGLHNATYQCSMGYRGEDGVETAEIECLQTGMWTVANITCTEVAQDDDTAQKLSQNVPFLVVISVLVAILLCVLACLCVWRWRKTSPDGQRDKTLTELKKLSEHTRCSYEPTPENKQEDRYQKSLHGGTTEAGPLASSTAVDATGSNYLVVRTNTGTSLSQASSQQQTAKASGPKCGSTDTSLYVNTADRSRAGSAGAVTNQTFTAAQGSGDKSANPPRSRSESQTSSAGASDARKPVRSLVREVLTKPADPAADSLYSNQQAIDKEATYVPMSS